MTKFNEIIKQSLQEIGHIDVPQKTNENLNLDSLMIVLLVGKLESKLNTTIPLDHFSEASFKNIDGIQSFLISSGVE